MLKYLAKKLFLIYWKNSAENVSIEKNGMNKIYVCFETGTFVNKLLASLSKRPNVSLVALNYLLRKIKPIASILL